MDTTFFIYPYTWISWILIFFGYLDNWLLGYHAYLDTRIFSLDAWILGYFGYQFFSLSRFWISYPSIRIFLDTFLNYCTCKKGNQIQVISDILYIRFLGKIINIHTLITLLRVPYLCHFGSSSFVLPIRPIVPVL